MNKRLNIFIIFALSLLSAVAQKVSFDALPLNQQIRQGDKFAVTFRLNNASASAPGRPNVSGCTVLYGPSTSSRESYSVINGNVTSSSSTDYTYYYRADKEGVQTVGSVSVNVDGRTYKSRPIQFRVLPGNGNGGGYQGQPSQSYSQRRQQAVDMDDIDTQDHSRPVNANDVFVRINLSKSSAYEQEAIVCTIKLYTKYQISTFMPTLQPSFEGFLAEELDVQPSLNQVESLNGQNYMTAVLKKCILFPQRSGVLTINSGNYDVSVVQYERVNMGFMSVSNPVERKIQIKSNKGTIKILPLPQPQPADFSGAVGSYSVNSRLVGNSFRTGEAASLIYTINGTGNIKYLKEPTIDFPSEVETYAPQTDINASVKGNNVSGTMTVNYTFEPQSVGDFTISTGKFVYFDPAKRQYVTLPSKQFNIKVAQGTNASGNRSDVTSKNTDILYIHTANDNLSRTHTLVIEKWWYWALCVIAAGALGGVFYCNRRNLARLADELGTRKARAGKEARKRLRVGEAFLKQGNQEKYHEALLQAMWGFLSDRLGIPQSQLSRDNINEELTRYGADETLRARTITILDECEMARYTPVSSKEQADKLFTEATDVIEALSSLHKK